MSEVLVIGHRNPDTDAICSALGYAEFKRRTGMPEAVACRCGDLNDRIQFVLDTFQVAAPRFVADVSPKVRDVMQTNVVHVLPRTTVVEALSMMDDRNIRVLPVLDESQQCLGLVSVFKMTKFFMPSHQRLIDSRRVVASVRNLASTLGARTLFTLDPDLEEDLVLMIGAMSLEAFSRRLPNYPPEKILLVVGDRADIQWLAIEKRVRVVVVTGGLPMEENLVELAKRHEVSVLLSPHDTATTAMLCRAAITVSHMVHEHYLEFREDETISAVRDMAAASQFQAFPVVDEHRKVVGILSKTDFLKKVERRLILVDHNELTQAVEGADEVEIVEVIDHHRIGSLTTPQPILFRNEPVGSTSTIVAEQFLLAGVEMSRSVAGLLLAGVVSDTLNLTSPTSTARDATVLARLEKASGVDATLFTEKLFASGSVLTSRAPAQAILADCKEYVEGGRTFTVAQIEELGFDAFWKRKDEVRSALDGHRASGGYFFAALMVTDVVRQTSLLLVSGTEAFVHAVGYPQVEPGVFEMVGVVSRKKQLLPFLTGCLKAIGA